MRSFESPLRPGIARTIALTVVTLITACGGRAADAGDTGETGVGGFGGSSDHDSGMLDVAPEAPEASGGTGAGDSGGTGGASSGGAGAGAIGGAGGGTPCVWGVASCPTGQYCNAPGCGLGTCAPISPEAPDKDPVCGCDGITYWNAALAAHHSMSVKAEGVCSPGVDCGWIGVCDNPAHSCNQTSGYEDTCLGGPLAEYCWVLPTLCPSSPRGRSCTGFVCSDECSLIKSGHHWFPDSTC